MNAVIRDMAEKLVLAIYAAIKEEEPLERAKQQAYEAYCKANDEYMKSRRNIAELCAGLDAMVPPPASYPLPSSLETTRGPSPKYGAVRARCHELRAIAERNRELEERNARMVAESRGNPPEALQGPEEVI